ncbi:MAG: hypothetical protein Q8911_00375 [Bacillota bacterium]|nr:hypothetical protein [Bacillota bacterium]
MKNLNDLNHLRIIDDGDEYNGAFEVKIKGEKYFVIVSNGLDWEHVSVSSKHKIPSWTTMNTIKDMFFHENEAVIQIHPPKSDYVNVHKNCLHLWRPLGAEMPLPPKICV